MKEGTTEWLKAKGEFFTDGRNALKNLELIACATWITENQEYPGFWMSWKEPARDDRQGKIWIDQTGDEPVLMVNWDEIFSIKRVEEVFKDVFTGDFTSSKIAVITGVRA